MADATIKFDADVVDAIKGIEQISKEGAKAAKKLSDDFGAVKFNAIVELGQKALQAGRQIADALRIPIQEASKFEDTVNGLTIAFGLAGITSKEATDDFLEFANSIQKTTKFSDDAVISTASLIEGLANLPTDQLQRATKASLDLSSALRIDLDSAARLVGKAAEGNVASFKKFGIEVKKGKDDAETFANALDQLEKKFGGAAEASVNSYAGATAQLSNAMADVLKQIGLIIIKNPSVIDSVQESTKRFNGLADSIEKNRSTFDKFVTGVVAGAQIILDVITGLKSELGQGSIFGIDESGLAALRNARNGQSVGAPERGLGGPNPRDNILAQQNAAAVAARKANIDAEKLAEQQKKNAEARKKDEDRQFQDILSRAEANRKLFNDQKGYGEAIDAKANESARVTLKAQAEENKAAQKSKSDRFAAAASGVIGGIQQGGAAGVASAASGLLSSLGPQGAAVGAALQFLSQGPEAVKAQLQGFIDGIPQIIDAIAESIPVVIDVLAANSGKITTALSLQMPLVATTLSVELVRQSPNIAVAFANSLINEAGRIAQSIADAVKGAFTGGGGGGLLGNIGNVQALISTGGLSAFRGKLGFATGGFVPRGTPGLDRQQIAVTGGEEVLTQSQSQDLSILKQQVAQLVQSGGANQAPMVANIEVKMGLETFARLSLEASRRGFRLVTT